MSLPRLPFALADLKRPHTHAVVGLLNRLWQLAALALTLFWATRLLAPGAVAALPADAEPGRGEGADQALARLFGVQPGAGDASLSGIALTGVFAPQGGGTGGFATFRTAKGGVGVTVGQEVSPGVILEAVAPNQAILVAGGRRQTLTLPTPDLAVITPATPPELSR